MTHYLSVLPLLVSKLHFMSWLFDIIWYMTEKLAVEKHNVSIIITSGKTDIWYTIDSEAEMGCLSLLTFY